MGLWWSLHVVMSLLQVALGFPVGLEVFDPAYRPHSIRLFDETHWCVFPPWPTSDSVVPRVLCSWTMVEASDHRMPAMPDGTLETVFVNSGRKGSTWWMEMHGRHRRAIRGGVNETLYSSDVPGLGCVGHDWFVQVISMGRYRVRCCSGPGARTACAEFLKKR